MSSAEKPVKWPPKLSKKFPMSLGKRGYYKSFNGKTKFVCGKLSPRAAEQRLNERRDELSGKLDAAAGIRRGSDADANGMTVKDLCNEFMAWLRQRAKTKRPRPLSLRTYDDYRLALQVFADTTVDGGRLAERAAVELGPRDFSAFAGQIPGTSPYTASRYVAAVTAMYSWANDNDRIPHPVKFGSDFKKASVAELDAARADVEKAFGRDHVRRILGADDKGRVVRELPPVWRAILLLCLNCAFTNRDVGRLPRDPKIVDLDGAVVQFRRGKKGRAYRKAPLKPETVAALRAYGATRPAAANPDHDGLFFLTQQGHPFVREKEHLDVDGNLMSAPRIDSAGQWFGDYLRELGLKTKGASDGRSLSGLRTTFRTEADAMPVELKDNDAIDLVMGHRRRHISAQYVERFPVSKLHGVVDFVWSQLFDGWSCQLSDRPAGVSG